jgi:hypothetical protein
MVIGVRARSGSGRAEAVQGAMWRGEVVKENIEHHIEEEEEDNMFPKARGIFSREELQQLGAVKAGKKKEFLDA